MPEIVRHLVDEEGHRVGFAAAVTARGGKRLFTEEPNLLGLHLGKDARIARVAEVRLTPAKIADDLLDVGQFLRALDLGVRSQDLFEQRRARARQTYNENRISIRYPPAAAAGEELASAHLDLLTGIVLDDFRAIVAFRTLQRVAEFVVVEGIDKCSSGSGGVAARRSRYKPTALSCSPRPTAAAACRP